MALTGLHEQPEKAAPKSCLLHMGESKLCGHARRQCGRLYPKRVDKEECEKIRLLLQTICHTTFVDFFYIPPAFLHGNTANMNTYFTFPLFSCKRQYTIYMLYIRSELCLFNLTTYLSSISFSILL